MYSPVLSCDLFSGGEARTRRSLHPSHETNVPSSLERVVADEVPGLSLWADRCCDSWLLAGRRGAVRRAAFTRRKSNMFRGPSSGCSRTSQMGILPPSGGAPS